MSNRTLCYYLTRRGRRCRNPAAPGTDPPACARHRGAGAWQLAVEVKPPGKAAGHFYFPAPSAEERLALEASGLEADLRAEVALARVVLRRLMATLDARGGELPPEELRRLTSLIFAGTRTVAQLLARRSAGPADTQEWMRDVLDALARQRASKTVEGKAPRDLEGN